MKRAIGDRCFAIQTGWLRITQNPDAPRYPRSGDFINLAGHNVVPDGRYLVKIVTEFEPAFIKNEDKRDIRISLTDGTEDWHVLNGASVMQAMVGCHQEAPRHTEERPGEDPAKPREKRPDSAGILLERL